MTKYALSGKGWPILSSNYFKNEGDKFALLRGEAQLCLPYVCLKKSNDL